jgi:predicted RNA-binding protein (virulence factor B family)
VRQSASELLLDGAQRGDILLPKRLADPTWKPGDRVEVFVYCDSQDRLAATTLRPKGQVGEFALLRCKETGPIGAFMDWGMPKDLLVPFREQRVKLRKDESYLVYIYYDRVSGRIAGSTKLDKYLSSSKYFYKTGEEVELIAWQMTDLGCKFIINHDRWGMVFHNEIFQPVERGERMRGYIKRVRPDGRIDLALQKPGYERVSGLAERLLAELKAQGGFMPLTAKTPPDQINALFGVSKKTFKNALGALYKKRLLTISDDGIRLV